MISESPFDKLKLFYKLYFSFINDLGEVDIPFVLQKITFNAQFSLVYILLLGASTIVCTLGLLLSSAPVVIGGMIISPLMWPLIKIAVGFSSEQKTFVKQALLLLLFSILISLISAYVITLISPIKAVNDEISSRTTPTLLDLIVAIVAGIIAALGVAQKKISDTLAGVAIATSLMPPLCVAGIGLALNNASVASGAFLLFFSNIISIIFAAIVVFIVLGVKRENMTTFGWRGILSLTFVLLLTAIPLFYLLQGYSFKTTVHRQVSAVLSEELKRISPSIFMDDVTTDVKQTGEVAIRVKVLMPRGLSLDYSQKQQLVSSLEETVGKDIDLQLFVQELVSLQSDVDREHGKLEQIITQTITREIASYGSSLSIDTLIIDSQSPGHVTIDLILISDPSIQFTTQEREDIEALIARNIGKSVQLNIEILPRLQLKSQPDLENEQIKADIRSYFLRLSQQIEITSINISGNSHDLVGQFPRSSVSIDIACRIPLESEIDESVLEQLSSILSEKYKGEYILRLSITRKEMLLYRNSAI